MGSGGAGRDQGRKTNLSKVDNTNTPRLETYFLSDKPPLSPSTPSTGDDSPSSPNGTPPHDVYMEAESEEDEDKAHL
jgi:hypothetical protein